MTETLDPAGATASPQDISRRLRTDGYASGRIDDALGPAGPLTTIPAWHAFLGSWDRLATDPFMADGGTYRLRRYSEFDCAASPADSPGPASVRLHPHRAYHQTKDINYLNGGADRLFEPFEPAVAEGEVVRTLLGWCAQRLDEASGRPGTWFAQCFQNRILARSSDGGKPTPEGIHRDGVDYVFTVVVARHSITGGVSSLYPALADGGHGSPLVSVRLDPPADFLLNDDELTLHGVTPVLPEIPGGDGYRDTFIAVLTRRD